MKWPNKTLVLGAMQLLAFSAPTIAADSQVIDIPVEFIWTDGKPLPPPMRPAHMYLGVGLAPGDFYVKGSLRWLDNLFLGHNTSVPLNLDRLAKTVGSKAAEGAVPADFEATPHETRFGRVVAGPNFNSSDSVSFRVGFYDADTRDALMLVYFDRPCHLSGVDRRQPYIPIDSPPRVDVQVDAPGWVWIAVHKTGESTYTEVRVPAPHPVFLITPTRDDLYKKYQQGVQ